MGIIPELLTRNTSHPLLWFSFYHHTLHTLAFALVCAAAAFWFAGSQAKSQSGLPRQPVSTHPWLTALLVFISFHLHLLCDLAGARGPDGYQWPIPYLSPFSNAIQLSWHGQWALNAWQNLTFTALLLLVTLWLTWRYGESPLELISGRANEALVRTLRQRFAVRNQI